MSGKTEITDQEFVESIVKAIVDHPEEVVTGRTLDERGVLIQLTVNREDMGKVIGREGRTAKAIRSLLRVFGARNESRINLKIVDPEGGSADPEGTVSSDPEGTVSSDPEGTVSSDPEGTVSSDPEGTVSSDVSESDGDKPARAEKPAKTESKTEPQAEVPAPAVEPVATSEEKATGVF